MVISENAPLYFSENASRLFFGTAPEPKQKDTTLLAENRPDVQVWSWDEKVQYTQQSFNKATDLKRSYTAIYNLGSGRLLQLATEELPTLQTADEGNAIWRFSPPQDLTAHKACGPHASFMIST